MHIDLTDMEISLYRAEIGANLGAVPTVRTSGIDAQPYSARALFRRDDTEEPWRCSVVILYTHEVGDTASVPRIISVQFNDPCEDWSTHPEHIRRLAARRPQAPELVKELAGRLIDHITP